MYDRFDFHEPMTPARAKDLFGRIASDATHHSPRTLSSGQTLALYGAGNLGRMAREYLDRLGIPIGFVVDANAAHLRTDPYWAGVQLLSPDEVPATWRSEVLLAVCVVTSPYAEFGQRLAASGWRDVVPFYDIAEGFRDRHPLANGWFAPPFGSADAVLIERALDAWADDVSRAHHLQFIAWRRLRQEWHFTAAPVIIEDRFFIPAVMGVLGDDEAFVDVGAHVGSVTQRFVDAVAGYFCRIWAIEPDPENLAELKATVANMAPAIREHIDVISAVVANDRMDRKFLSGLGYASQCCDLGVATTCHTLDDLGLAPSFMKLHLEGMELDALRGAQQTLQRCRPIVAVTVYHNANGLWAIPLWLHEHLDGYSLLMRTHGWCGTGAVVYAIPNERCMGWR